MNFSPPAEGGTNRPQGAPHRPLLADPRPLFGFFTRLPVGRAATLTAVVAAFPAVALVGWATGFVTAVPALALADTVPPSALATLLLVLMVGLTGLNATDGLLDLGDGLMVHGDAARRLAVMHDSAVGVGAVVFALFTYLLSLGALAGLLDLAPALASLHAGAPAASAGVVAAAAMVAAEVLARLPYLLLAWRGHSSHGGLGSAFLAGFGTPHLAVGLLWMAPVLLSAFWLGLPAVLLAAAATLATATMLLRTAHRLLGGVGGDVFGASQELARAAALWGLVLGAAFEVSL